MSNKTLIWNYPPLSIFKDVSEEEKNITLRDLLISEKSDLKMIVPLGRDMLGETAVMDLSKNSHVIILGPDKEDKSSLIKTFISSLLFRASPNEIKFVLVDSGRELLIFNGIAHLLTPVISEVDRSLSALKWLVDEIDRRKKTIFTRGVKNINEFNQVAGFQAYPFIVVVINGWDDIFVNWLADHIEESLNYILINGPSVGISLLVSAVKPTKNVISQFPFRILFRNSVKNESMKFDSERLIKGDFLFLDDGAFMPKCIEGVNISPDELSRLRFFIINNNISQEVVDNEEN